MDENKDHAISLALEHSVFDEWHTWREIFLNTCLFYPLHLGILFCNGNNPTCNTLFNYFICIDASTKCMTLLTHGLPFGEHWFGITCGEKLGLGHDG